MFWKTGAGSPTKEEWNAMKKIVGFISEHKKLLIVLAVLAVAVVVWQVYAGRAQAAAAQAMQANVQTLTLQRGDLARTLSANGSVQSGNAAQAATKLTYPVSEVLVKVGDTVDVYVISFDTEKKKISLGMKDRNEDPCRPPSRLKSSRAIWRWRRRSAGWRTPATRKKSMRTGATATWARTPGTT